MPLLKRDELLNILCSQVYQLQKAELELQEALDMYNDLIIELKAKIKITIDDLLSFKIRDVIT